MQGQCLSHDFAFADWKIENQDRNPTQKKQDSRSFSVGQQEHNDHPAYPRPHRLHSTVLESRTLAFNPSSLPATHLEELGIRELGPARGGNIAVAAVPTLLVFIFCQNIIMKGIILPQMH